MGILHRWKNLFREEALDQELDQELQFHLAETADRLMANGLCAEEAWRQARRRIGNYTYQKEETRTVNINTWLDSARADLVYGLRQLQQTPGFAAVAVLSLALGIGANSAIFQLVNALRLKLLPVVAPEELVEVVYDRGSARAGRRWSRTGNFTHAQWLQLQGQRQAFSTIAAWSDTRFNLANGGEPRPAAGLYVSGDFFQLLGVGPQLGRTLQPSDDTAGCTGAAFLSHAFWQREFGKDPGVLSRTVRLNGHTLPIVGVAPPSFFGLEVGRQFDVAVPLCADAALHPEPTSRKDDPQGWWLSVVARLRPGWSPEAATAHLLTLSPGIMQATLPPTYHPVLASNFLKNKLRAASAGTGISNLRSRYEQPLWLLLGATGLVLLIACANLANLLLARASARQREIAVRLALGASRLRLVRQLLAESLLLAVAGTALGTLFASLASRFLVQLISTKGEPLFFNTALDWRVFLFTAALACGTCLLFGLLPALRATVLSPLEVMRGGGRGITAGRERYGLRRFLVAAQVALSLVLLVGALLFTRSLHNLMTANAGFQPEGVVVVSVDFNSQSFSPEKNRLTYQFLSEQLSQVSGVVAVAQSAITPISGSGWNQGVGADGKSAASSGQQSLFNRVAPGYFRTMGTRLLDGRDFQDTDTPSSPRVAIVNESFARTYFGPGSPLGHTFQIEGPKGQPEPLFQVVGMVENSKYSDLREEFRPIAYFPVGQDPSPAPDATFVMRYRGDLEPVKQQAKQIARKVGPAVSIEFQAFDAQLAESLQRERLMAVLSGCFGLLAALLSSLGLYGVIAYMVARRSGEIGIRMALGARRGDVIGLVFREAALLVAAGLLAGLVLALAAGNVAASQLYGLSPYDGPSLLLAALLLSVTAMAASYLPARRAAAVDPLVTLRND